MPYSPQTGRSPSLWSLFCFLVAFIGSPLSYAEKSIDFSPEEQAFLDSNPAVVVGVEVDWPPVDYVVDGKHTGLASDYLRIIKEETGLDIHIVQGFTWNELLTMLVEQRIDLLPAIYKSESREEQMNFTSDYVTLRHYAFALANRHDLKSMADLNGQTIAVLKGYSYLDNLREQYPQIKILLVNSTIEAIDAVITGQADSIIESTALIGHYLKENNIQGLNPVFAVKFGINNVHMATRKDLPILRDIIDKVLSNIDKNTQQAIAQRWVELSLPESNGTQNNLFTPQEQSYLNKKRQLKACIDPSWYPYEGFRNGKPSGMSTDYLKYFEEQIQIPINIVHTESWPQTLEYTRLRKCDFITLASDKPERRKYLNFATPHMTAPLALATQVDEVFFSDFSELIGKQIGIMRGYSPGAEIREEHPGIILIEYDSILEGLSDVQSGSISGFLDSVATLSYQIQNSYPGTLKISGKFDYDWSFGIAARNDEPMLVEILDKVVLGIPDSVHTSIKNTWLGVRYEQAVDYKTLWQVVIGFGVILLLILVRYHRISQQRHEISAKNAELATINKELEEQKASAQHMASHDLLTSLPNRAQLLNHLEHAIQLAYRQKSKVAVLFIDLDRFKYVNDSLGHHIGDELLRSVSRVLAQRVRKTDTLARIGGDEFILVMEAFEDENSPSLVAQSMIDALKKPFSIAEHQFQISASVGIALYPDDSHEIHTLIKHADIAMYQAKELGRNQFRYYTQELSEKTEKRLEIESALRAALKHNQFRLVYQPIINLRTSKVSHAEALIRWDHPVMGTISPVDFIPIAEENGLIHEIGLWVFRQACQQLREWRERGVGVASLSVNVSSIQFQRNSLIDNFKKILEQEKVIASAINIEITESHLMDQTERNIAFLKALKNAGHSISVDDFGVGYSSMSYMKRLPLDVIKIDRSFISDIPDDKNDIQITQAIIALAHNLGYASVAEGVENIQQMEFLRKMGSHYAQGFFFSRPLNTDEFEDKVVTLNSHTAPTSYS
ncbi:MAG: EAL domain-containing protein [Neptuniibacter sp.]